mmetsp:Transcript_42570/g.102617  ORF Transcript_42570/g.102617 Transcript_42570/m.102617 type:complete len:909 (+) Transcript_42570:4485-7211(+)
MKTAPSQMHLLRLLGPHRRRLRQEQSAGPGTHDGHGQELGPAARDRPPLSSVCGSETHCVVAVERHGIVCHCHGDLELLLIHAVEVVIPRSPALHSYKMRIPIQIAVVMGAVHHLDLPIYLGIGALLAVDPLRRARNHQIDIPQLGDLGNGVVSHGPREPRGFHIDDSARDLLPAGLTTAPTRAIAHLVPLGSLVLHDGDGIPSRRSMRASGSVGCPPGCLRARGTDQRRRALDPSHLLRDRVPATVLLNVDQLDPLPARNIAVGALALPPEREPSPSDSHGHPNPIPGGVIRCVRRLARNWPGGPRDPPRPRPDVRHGLLPPPLAVGVVVRVPPAGLGGLGVLVPHEDVALQEAVPGVHEVLPGVAPLVHMVQAQLLAGAGARDRHVVLHNLTEDLRIHKPASHRQVHAAPSELLPRRHLALRPLRHPRDPELHVGIRPVRPASRRHIHAPAALHQRLAGRWQDPALHCDLLGAGVLAGALGHPDTPHIDSLRGSEAEPHPGPGALVPVAVQAPAPPGRGVVPVEHVGDAVRGAPAAGVGPAVELVGHAQGGHVHGARALLLAGAVDGYAGVEGHIVDLPAEAQSLSVVEQDVLIPSGDVPLLHTLAINQVKSSPAPAGEPTHGVGAHPTILRHLASVRALRALVQVHGGYEVSVGEIGEDVPPPASVGVGSHGGLFHSGSKHNVVVSFCTSVLHVYIISSSRVSDTVQRARIEPEDLERTVVRLDLEGHRHGGARRLQRSLPTGACTIVPGAARGAQVVLAHAIISVKLANEFAPVPNLGAPASLRSLSSAVADACGVGVLRKHRKSLETKHIGYPLPVPGRNRISPLEIVHGPLRGSGAEVRQKPHNAGVHRRDAKPRGLLTGPEKLPAIVPHIHPRSNQRPPGGPHNFRPVHRPISVRIPIHIE